MNVPKEQGDMQRLSPNLLKRTNKVLAVYGGRSSFLRKFNPDMQIVVAKNEEKAFLSNTPSLGLLKRTYGKNVVAMWLMPQIWDLCEYTNSKGKLNESQALQLAEMIAIEYGYMKVTEILLFFYRLKCGRYGKFYGSIDPMAIMMALDEFRKERRDFLAGHKEEEPPRTDTITAEEYFKRKGISEEEQKDVMNIIKNFKDDSKIQEIK